MSNHCVLLQDRLYLRVDTQFTQVGHSLKKKLFVTSMNCFLINMNLNLRCTLLGLQHGVILGEQPYGLGLNETLLPQYLKELGYKTHIVGKVYMYIVYYK